MQDMALLLSPERKAWDIDATLCRFVNDPQGLREQLRDVDGLIAGGLALQFLAKEEWPASDLDICVRRDKGQQLADYLVNVEGYDLASKKVGKYNWSEVDEVHAYDRPTADPQVVRIIEVIFTKVAPVRSVLTECYMTALVNVITWNAAYSLFPIPTIKERRTFSLKEPDWFHNVLLHKYKSRGYQDVQRRPTVEEDTVCGGCFGMIHETFTRRVGDGFTWKFDLPTEGMTPPQVSSSIEDVEFKIKRGAKPEDGLQWMELQPID